MMTGAMVRLSAWSTGSWYGEQRAGAVSEQDYTESVYWRTGKGRSVFCDVNELDESIYGPSEEAVQRVVDAWCDEGTHPAYHRAAQARLERQWPVLYSSIQELVKSNVIR